MAGTEGRVYGGDPNLIHVPDGTRAELGKAMAKKLDMAMREGAENRTVGQRLYQALCPGCYMVVGFDMLVTLANQNGQSLNQLADSMIGAFEQLKVNPELIEEIFIKLDPCDAEPGQD
ncbi:MAG: hypothetical protein ACTHJR_11240 [Sphingomonas sp.]|uniref:hypothetical protein n=1 Tax=Sphingomonas sp. TaxID=28214 RepID=UPI003F7DD933